MDLSMKQTDLDILLREGEGSMLEYKESLSSSFARDVVAFANSSGGKILLGVRDDGTVVGIRDSNKLRAQIQDIARNCDPSVKVLIGVVGKVMVITVRESETKPVQCREGFFWRQGAGTQKLSRDEIRDFSAAMGRSVLTYPFVQNSGILKTSIGKNSMPGSSRVESLPEEGLMMS